MNIFQGEGVVKFVRTVLLFCKRVGINLGKQTVYHMCKTWLKKVHGGWGYGG